MSVLCVYVTLSVIVCDSQGLSGFFPSAIAAIQAPGDANRFSTGAFFVVIAGLMAVSCGAFAALVRMQPAYAPTPTVGRRVLYPPSPRNAVELSGAVSPRSSDNSDYDDSSMESVALLDGGVGGLRAGDDVSDAGASGGAASVAAPPLPLPATAVRVPKRITGSVKAHLSVLAVLSCVQNGVIVSIATYVLLPFVDGNKVMQKPRT